MLAPLSAHFAVRWVRKASDERPEDILFVASAHAHVVFAPGTVWFVGPISAPQTLTINASQLIGYRFNLGGAAHAFGVRPQLLLNAALPIEQLLGTRVARESELEAAFERRPQLPGAWRAVLGEFEYAPPDEAKLLALIRARYDVSERTARRYVTARFGFGAKALERVLRFQRFCALMRRGTMSLSAAAYVCGYADQAHLARESRALSTLSPSVIREQLRDDRISRLAC